MWWRNSVVSQIGPSGTDVSFVRMRVSNATRVKGSSPCSESRSAFAPGRTSWISRLRVGIAVPTGRNDESVPVTYRTNAAGQSKML